MSVASGTEKRTAAQHLASIWGDGKRRIVVARRTSIRSGYQTLTYLPTQVIDDPHTIALLEEHGIQLIDLEVNGRPKRGQWIDGDADQAKNIDQLANAFGIMPNLLHAAIENGGTHIDAAAKALAERFETAYADYLGTHPTERESEPAAERGVDWKPGSEE